MALVHNERQIIMAGNMAQLQVRRGHPHGEEHPVWFLRPLTLIRPISSRCGGSFVAAGRFRKQDTDALGRAQGRPIAS